MTKSELRSGMIIENAGGYRYIVIKTDFAMFLIQGESWLSLDKFNEDLSHKSLSDFSIVKVFNITSAYDGCIYYPSALEKKDNRFLTPVYDKSYHYTYNQAIAASISGEVQHIAFFDFLKPAEAIIKIIDLKLNVTEELGKKVWKSY